MTTLCKRNSIFLKSQQLPEPDKHLGRALLATFVSHSTSISRVTLFTAARNQRLSHTAAESPITPLIRKGTGLALAEARGLSGPLPRLRGPPGGLGPGQAVDRGLVAKNTSSLQLIGLQELSSSSLYS